MKSRPSDEEFDELKRARDDAIRRNVVKFCEEIGADPATVAFHSSHSGPCYCACPSGPCQHIWDGPEHTEDTEGGGFMSSCTCSRCGAVAAYHDMRCGP